MKNKEKELFPIEHPDKLRLLDLCSLLGREPDSLRNSWLKGTFPIPTGKIERILYWDRSIIEIWMKNNTKKYKSRTDRYA